jgi:hypothetical protein
VGAHDLRNPRGPGGHNGLVYPIRRRRRMGAALAAAKSALPRPTLAADCSRARRPLLRRHRLNPGPNHPAATGPPPKTHAVHTKPSARPCSGSRAGGRADAGEAWVAAQPAAGGAADAGWAACGASEEVAPARGMRLPLQPAASCCNTRRGRCARADDGARGCAGQVLQMFSASTKDPQRSSDAEELVFQQQKETPAP